MKKILLFSVTLLFSILLLFTYAENKEKDKAADILNKKLSPLIYEKNQIEREIAYISESGSGVVILVLSGDLNYIYTNIYPILEDYNMDAALVVSDEVDNTQLNELESSGWEVCYSVDNNLFSEICPQKNDKQIHIYSRNADVPEDYFTDEQCLIKMMRWNKSGTLSFLKSSVKEYSVIAYEIPVYKPSDFDTKYFKTMLNRFQEYIEVNRLKVLTPSEAYDFIANQDIEIEKLRSENENKRSELTKKLDLINQEIEEIYNSYR